MHFRQAQHACAAARSSSWAGLTLLPHQQLAPPQARRYLRAQTKITRHTPVCEAMRSLQECQQNDVLQMTFTSGSSSSVEHVQVMQGWDGSSAVLLRKGQLLRLAAAAGEAAGALQLSALGERFSNAVWQ
jgi:hypothetical protein